ncbi:MULTISPECIES: hypothetical protein [Calothrix]|uniref:Uncharacterized protein n=2 Tax=Calothrix TaxID=1186 RepID=A0ABR8ABT9_9CYAN|nr:MULTISPECIES: hypothetical protein [Calothrix]MBD2197338.1 hypothetical protein [Calothrix parietina FACHB-288]MBD2228736.1 hypothetical protein [Calothrix anomala FACHB-343]
MDNSDRLSSSYDDKVHLFYHFGKRKINVGWVEDCETQQYQSFRVLGFVPQPNLRS